MGSFACMIMPEGPVGRIAEVARQAERLGCARIWIPDEGIAGRDCYVALAAVAAATDHVPIGTGITNAYTRHPGVTAAAIASLDELSGGRAVLGIGAGGGLALSPLALERRSPLRAVRELITTSRALWAGDTIEYDGVAGGFSAANLAYGRADIPIWIAGRGPKMLALGGELADGFILSYVHKELIGEHVASLREGAAAAGRPLPRICYMTMIVTDDAELAQARAGLTFRLVDSPDHVKARIGMTADDTAELREAIAAGGPPAAAHLVRDEWVDRFVIVGSEAECAAELGGLMSEHGLDEFQFSIEDLDAADGVLARAAALGLA